MCSTRVWRRPFDSWFAVRAGFVYSLDSLAGVAVTSTAVTQASEVLVVSSNRAMSFQEEMLLSRSESRSGVGA
jgi:hypothetical protein